MKKNKNNNYVTYILVSLLIGILFYLSTSMLLVSLAVFLVFFLYLILRVERVYKKTQKRNQRVDFAYNLINNTISSISVYGNINEAVDHALTTYDISKIKEIGNISNMEGLDKLQYLSSYFSLPIYDAFLNILELYQENGGNILDMSEHLLSETRQIQNNLLSTNTLYRSKATNVVMLWIFALIVPVFIRFALVDFYSSLISSAIYVAGIVLTYALALITIEIFCNKFSNQRVKGVDL
ncbi:MAG: hypothetical protein LUD22_00680 [Coprobacillus sp.]|nr:hypothetical protein [Coprobacillus sp.]